MLAIVKQLYRLALGDNNPTKVFPLLNLEPELFEIVANNLDKRSIANLRLTSRACAANTEKTFKEACCTSILCLLWDEQSLTLLVELSANANYGSAVKTITICINEYPDPDAPEHFSSVENLEPEILQLCLSSRKAFDVLRASDQDFYLLKEAFTNFKRYDRLEKVKLADEQEFHTQCGSIGRLSPHLWSKAQDKVPVAHPDEWNRRPFELVIHALAGSELQPESLSASQLQETGLEWCVDVGDELDVWLEVDSELNSFFGALCSAERLETLVLFIKNGDDHGTGVSLYGPDVDSRIIRKVMGQSLPALLMLDIKCTTFLRERMDMSDLLGVAARNKNLDTLALEGLELVGFEDPTNKNAEDRLEELLGIEVVLFTPIC
ncbi:hypothetical protein Slin15195_G040000 [Septoria linicola]|uniref:F-box domain-containing protein n=1 Tax=Septoria linicola TaxID=215465 RepID=A0A9Q9ATZ2_9PEZI|nr:hypothetical protein Slin15195_G040000 [Septoria linicola]